MAEQEVQEEVQEEVKEKAEGALPDSIDDERYAEVRVESVVEREFSTESKAKQGEPAPAEEAEGEPEGEETDGDANAQAESDETPPKEDKPADEDKEEPHPKSAEGRLRQVLRERAKERADAEREIQALKEQLAAKEAPAEPKEEQQVLAVPKPDDFLDEFGDLDEDAYQKGIEEYAEKLAERKLAEKAPKEEEKDSTAEAVQEMFTRYDEREAAYAEQSESYQENRDYVQSLLQDPARAKDDNPLGFVSPQAAAISKAILLADEGPAIVDHLGENPEALEAMLKATDALEIGMQIQRIALATGTPAEDPPVVRQPPARRVSRAPKPRPTVNTGGGGSEPDLDKLAKTDTAAYAKARGLTGQGW